MDRITIEYKRRVANDTHDSNRIRVLREAIGMTQAELARQAHVTAPAINKLEKGHRGLDQDWMRRLAPILRCEPADLLPPEDNRYLLSPEERVLIEALRSSTPATRASFAKVSRAMLDQAEDEADAA